jgi:hypothetical protein
MDKQDIKDELKTQMNRVSKPHEEINAETDALLLVRILIKKVNDLDSRITALEKPIKLGKKLKK